jgi:hypothetical protein
LKTLAILIATEIWRQITLKTVPSFQIYWKYREHLRAVNFYYEFTKEKK